MVVISRALEKLSMSRKNIYFFVQFIQKDGFAILLCYKFYTSSTQKHEDFCIPKGKEILNLLDVRLFFLKILGKKTQNSFIDAFSCMPSTLP